MSQARWSIRSDLRKKMDPGAGKPGPQKGRQARIAQCGSVFRQGEKRVMTMIRAILMLMVLQILAVPSTVSGDHRPGLKTIYKKNSLYQFITVEDNQGKNERYLITDNNRNLRQGGMNLKAPDELLFEYTRLSFTALAFLDREPLDVLFVGLGAGAMPRYFTRYFSEAKVDVVEIDPDIYSIAKKYFLFAETRNMKVHIADGRVFVKRTPRKYDMIFLDAYRGDNIPFHLTTIEFLEEVKGKLKWGGVVVSNILSESNNKYFWSMIRTYREGFEQLFIYKGESAGNFVFVAQDKGGLEMEESEILQKAGQIRSSKGMGINLKHPSWDYMENSELVKMSELLTDDFAPVNIYRYQKIRKNQGKGSLP